MNIMPQFLRLFLALSMVFVLSGCVHYMTIQQGVQLQQSQIDQLQPGMSKTQVEYVLGTPNLIDPYHPDTWYYIYTSMPSRQPMTEQKLAVYFNNDQLVKVTGDFNIPSGLNGAAK
jgi:outer membrane protein assembly factor BamE